MEPNPVSSHPLSGVHASDQEGLICGFLFEASGIGRAIELKQALDWLRAPAVRSGFIWLHFNLSNVASERWIRLNLNLPPEFFEALQLDSRSTRIEDASDNLIAVVNDVAFEFSFDPSDIATLWACVNDHVVVSTRRHPLQSIDRLRQAVRQGCRFDSSVSLLNHLMHDQGDVLVRIVRDVTIQVDGIEDKLLGGRLQSQRADLGRLRRVLVRLQRLLAPEPAALFRLLKQPPPWVSPADLDELRQSTEEFSLVLRDLMALQERIKLLQEEMAAQISEQTNKSVFTLTVVTVLALPINIIAGMLGMNVGGIPLSDHPHGFFIIALIVLTFTVVAGWLAFRKKNE
jgi:zinc transporter